MTPPKRTYYSKFVFSLKAILPDLEDDAAQVKEELANKGQEIDEESIIIAWVMFQLERHLYLHLQLEGQHANTHRLQSLIGNAFFYRHEVARDLLLSQIRPTLSREGSVVYLDRLCNAEIRLPDLRLNFL
jgi:hypothetical protein